MKTLAFLVLSLLPLACSSNPGEPTDSSGEELRRHHAPACSTTDDCVQAAENGSWGLSNSSMDECTQNHDFLYVCMACTNGRCSFHPGF
jgi:hypothetical protein